MALSTENTPQYDAKITKGGVTLGLKLSDGQGMHDPFSISQDQQSRSAVKVGSGDTNHSDYEPPYVTEEHRDWSIGRGMNDGDAEEGRFYDSKNAWTSQKGRILLGPQWTYGTGMKTSFGNIWHDTQSENYLRWTPYKSYDMTTYSRLAVRFLADSTFVMRDIEAIVKTHGSCAASISLYQDNGGAVGTLISTVALNTNGNDDGIYHNPRYTFNGDYTITSGTWYWISIEASTAITSENYLTVLCLDDATDRVGNTIAGYDGSWNYSFTGAREPFFRISSEWDTYKPHFTLHHGLPFMVMDYDDNTVAPTIYVNGDMGMATSSGYESASDKSYLYDTAKTWNSDQFNGWQLTLVKGSGSEAEITTYDITDSSSGWLELDGEWQGVPPDSSTIYIITNGDKWYEVTGHGIAAGPITDVKTINDITYILRGETKPIVTMRYPLLPNGSFDTLEGINGNKIEYALDSNSVPRIWIASNNYIEKSTFPNPIGAVDKTVYSLDLNNGQLVTNGGMELDANWSSVSTPDVNERSSEYAQTGTYSRKVVANADAQGITQTLTTVVGDYYEIQGSILIPDAATITNGDMELDSDWASEGSPTTNERSVTQAHGGTYSRKIVSAADDEGIKQTITGLTIGKAYSFIYWVYIDGASANGMTLTIDSTDIDAISATGSWVRGYGVFTATATSHDIKFLADGGVATFYIDDVSSGAANGCKLTFAGSNVGVVSALDTGSWVGLNSIIKATATDNKVQVLSNGGESVFYVDDILVKELPTSLRTSITEKIGALISYGEQDTLWAITNHGIYEEKQGNLSRVPLDEMRSVADPRNGQAVAVYDVYLVFSMLNGMVQRYYKSNLDNIGPDLDEGLPYDLYSTRRGAVADMVSYPTGVIMAIDAGKSDGTYGYSSILFYNNTGYHELYRSDVPGEQIRSLVIQPINGDDPDKLWFVRGSEIMWIPLDINPYTNKNYRYTYESMVESAWIYRGKHEVWKYLDEVHLFTKMNQYIKQVSADFPAYGVDADTIEVTVEYKVDNDTTWTTIGTFTSTGTSKLDVGSHDVEGKRIKYRLLIRNEVNWYTPYIEAVALDIIESIPVKDSWTMQFLLDDDNVTLLGTPEDTRVEDVVSAINTMRSTPAPVYFEARHSAYDLKWASILTFNSRPIANDTQGQVEKMVGTLTLIEA